ncbi:Isoprenylcysteine carboxyl methyltransferase [Kalmanozyma brasiliensis GHG001]|uniref:Protein-S-isoprenylcysteine O-methyltransferase n=1 Tax=Kalmanozyma brasiliensis (strain GHG001) TaxID=1365824 RepID=V5EY41_KALBG|nr:Isoprenylcysteine carboxyl methyltransferase [Kalmanozyma brasiliensis GHG001]EST07549.1 Isoprenylcysteine carboxyl methyltransferase [Kalmanozyma brasiliensis GHG001]
MSGTAKSSTASSVDGDHATTASTEPSAAATPTGKRGKSDATSASSQSWLSWLSDKYTIQYSIPPAYAPAALQVAITAFPLGIVFGLVLPRAFSFLTSVLDSKSAASWQDTPWWAFPQLHLYLLAWVTFHMLEFTVTASYNPTRLFSDSFLLNNGAHYHIAHLFSLLEFSLTAYLYPASKSTSIFTLVGIVLIIFGQTLRSMAMIHAHNNFSHILAFKKRTDHELVTTGVYAWTRHPSYVGFSYWAVGTQVMLGNKIAAVGFVGTLWMFFSRRIRAEEKALIEFFGQKYVDYKQRVGTGLPFI